MDFDSISPSPILGTLAKILVCTTSRWERTPKHKLAICKWYFAERPHGEGIVVCVDSKRTPNNYLKHNKPLNNAYRVMKKIVYSTQIIILACRN